MIKLVLTRVMSLSPHVLLSSASRERCVANLKQLPALLQHEFKPTIKASVLLPLCVVEDEVCLLYTLRSINLKAHGGQVSFPGGKMEGNESVTETALRETEEEIGILHEDIDIWAEMAPVQGRNKEMLITPVVGEIRNFDVKKLKPNVYEVDTIFTVPISALCDTNNHGHLKFRPPLPVFIYGNYNIWGITALITHMFLECFLPDDVYKTNFENRRFELHELNQTPSFPSKF